MQGGILGQNEKWWGETVQTVGLFYIAMALAESYIEIRTVHGLLQPHSLDHKSNSWIRINVTNWDYIYAFLKW